jgi:hypoxanthine phosphoribosyltransferase
MKKEITLGGLTFVHYIDAKIIKAKVKEMAKQISDDFDGKNPTFFVIMNGAFVFAADLLRKLNIDCDIKFIQVKSYLGLESSGPPEITWPLDFDYKDQHIIIIEDVVDSGNTLAHLVPLIEKNGVASVHVAAILIKKDAHKVDVEVKYQGIHIPDDFIIGYGLDYNGLGRNLKDVYQLKP